MGKKKVTLWSKILGTVTKLDQFGEDVGFTVKDGQRYHSTILGTLLSFAIFALLTSYGMQKLSKLIDYEETNVSE